MANFTAPYRFVPLNKDVLIPGWQDKVSHDVPFKDGVSGTIELDITNLTPMFIKDGDELEYSAHIEKDGKKLYYIPGSSLRGMFRSVAEVLAFGKMKIGKDYDKPFGFRNIFAENIDKKLYRQEIPLDLNTCGFLKKNKNNEFVILPCRQEESQDIDRNGNPTTCGFDRIKFAEIKDAGIEGYRPEATDTRNEKEKQDEVLIGNFKRFRKKYNRNYPIVKLNGKTQYLVCSGPADNKKTEVLFNGWDGSEIPVDKKVIEAFRLAYDASPYIDYIEEWLNDGKASQTDDLGLAVFYHHNKNNRITSIGIMRNYRLVYEHAIKDGIKQTSRNENRQEVEKGYDMVETLFGHINDNALKGRVCIGAAFCSQPLSDNQLKDPDAIKALFLSPNPAFFPMYIEQDGAAYKTYNSDDFSIAGRKRYCPHVTENDNFAHADKEGRSDEAPEMETSMRRLPAGMKFCAKISFHNLRPEELGLLLSAITFHNSAQCYHNIGLAKGYGMGKLSIKPTLRIDGEPLRYGLYLAIFENYMEGFVGNNWINTREIRALASIAVAHNSDELKVASPAEYSNAKNQKYGMINRKNFNKTFSTQLNDQDYIAIKEELEKEKNYRKLLVEAEKQLAQKNYAEAMEQCEKAGELLPELTEHVKLQEKINLEVAKIEQFFTIRNEAKTLKESKNYKAALDKYLEAQQMLSGEKFEETVRAAHPEIPWIDLGYQIDECKQELRKQDMGIIDYLKQGAISTTVNLAGKFRKWNELHPDTPVTINDVDAIAEIVKAAILDLPNSKKKSWINFAYWKPISDQIGEDIASKIFEKTKK